ncbi:glutathione S-transferase family protein [Microbulbifer yueqingensis]|uniref:Glutathione S-transferase n=1 Tax=Microbulbifer yueqingensis TaxID=658219 RepID=A0A1G8Z9F8_9GAMM|nr:glutathione S-transferase family protein [Microbulbifer yueqingensis]SDK11729.1 glutathione S-transferase [Microbulbifer yueqingensis]
MYQLFIGNKNYSSWSLRPWLLLRQLQIPFEEQLVPFEAGGNWDRFRRFSTSGRVPCLVDRDVRVWDSLAIIEYLAETHGRVWPASAASRAWARSVTAEMHSGFAALRAECPMNCGVQLEMRHVSPALACDLARIDEIWGEGLDRFGGPFLAGREFTAVDAFFAPVAVRAAGYRLPLDSAALVYAEHLLALPAMKDWVAEALREPWRDEGEERQMLASAFVIEDRRAPLT